ncbi:RecQ family ATP-dependent DNA helicase [Dactylococcopsis salina]|uniref:ATP-dependent DNA helicase RecQ n=1 Tax=Dactylococcopsis salina (strain PCC 8305) TaxID=13035 RepID=K9YXW8_DACS8|nr:RecQ family ATP-dependent DNA helicase [Dactylococcopsis salina]AFZ51786.1 ATP-dependent DNA helicase, RecQ family [Dactylococcopsis salina PCC 8305]
MDWEQVRDRLQTVWGYPDFRPPQGEIVRCLLEKKDVLVVLPTGGGKSICFQLPALLQTGLTLVVSPLVALMENQVQDLKQRGLPAASFHSEIDRRQRKEILKQLESQALRLLYLSPESLLSPHIWERLIAPELMINGLMLDEAHCLVQWGETFRPAYRRLGVVRETLLQFKPQGSQISIAAFTATADLEACQTIETALKLQTPTYFKESPYRQNLQLQVKRVCTPAQRKQNLLSFIQQRKQQSGLIYARSRSVTETLSQWLNNKGYKSEPYHAGLSAGERRSIEEKWLEGRRQFVIATCAFGMGINKPDLRWVVHYQPPLLLSEYLQEVGRGGRDGNRATALTLVSEPTGLLYPEDKQREQYFIRQLRQQYQKARELMKRIPTEGKVATVEEISPHGAIVLALLHGCGQLEWLDPFHYRLLSRKQTPVNLSKILKPPQQMNQFLSTRECRWRFLLEAFGFTSQGFRCGNCDRCLRQ